MREWIKSWLDATNDTDKEGLVFIIIGIIGLVAVICEPMTK